jgi:primosomal protein N' (replication factor Y)
MTLYYSIAVNSPFNQSILTYKAGPEMVLTRGMLVKVPLGKRFIDGCVLGEELNIASIDLAKIKEVKSIETEMCLSEQDCDFYQWMSTYYHYPLGMLIQDVLPTILKRPRKLSFDQGDGRPFTFTLNEEQADVVKKISLSGMNSFSKWLIHGVTGAGKTIIYLALIQKILEEKKSVLFLLPEINLTPQFLKTFQTFLNVPIYSYNSALSNSNKFGLWKLLQEDEAPKLVLAVRSGIFLPIKNLGLIIVDEEHDQSFKQDDHCTYNARDLSIKKAALQKIPVILGSATPTVETYKAFVDSAHYFALTKRALNANLPKVQLVDMRGRSKIASEKILWPFTSESIKKIAVALEKDEQVLVFINRLGYANYIQCSACGHQFSCPNCSVNLKHFKKRNQLSCQTCDYSIPTPDMCPECMNLNLSPKGFGTEKAHEILQDMFSKNVIRRFDRDEIKTFTQLENTLNEFHQKKIDILVGTQMLSKGHNFERVNLVVILGIDSQLNFPDFRSNERVYQALTQVSGRAGRFGAAAEVLIHTLAPENKIFSYLNRPTFHEFYQDEIPLRKMCSSPPFKKIILIYFSSKSQAQVIEVASRESQSLSELAEKHFKSVEILGPRPSMIEKKVNKFTWSIMLRSADINELHNLFNTFTQNYNQPHTISIQVDVDPYSFD